MTFNQLIDGIVKVTTCITPLALALITYLQLKIRNRQRAIHQQINGMQDKLIVAEKSTSRGEGHEEGRIAGKADEKADEKERQANQNT